MTDPAPATPAPAPKTAAPIPSPTIVHRAATAVTGNARAAAVGAATGVANMWSWLTSLSPSLNSYVIPCLVAALVGAAGTKGVDRLMDKWAPHGPILAADPPHLLAAPTAPPMRVVVEPLDGLNAKIDALTKMIDERLPPSKPALKKTAKAPGRLLK